MTLRDIVDTLGADPGQFQELVIEANQEGHNDEAVRPAVAAYLSDREVSDIADTFGVEKNQIINKKRKLTREGILEPQLPDPASMTEGRAGQFLERIQSKNQDDIFAGSSVSSWIAAAEYLDDWIMIREDPRTEFVSQYDCAYPAFRLALDKLVNTRTMERFYAPESVGYKLSQQLSSRRQTLEMIRLSTASTTMEVRERLASMKQNEKNVTVVKDELGGKRFYHTRPGRNL